MLYYISMRDYLCGQRTEKGLLPKKSRREGIAYHEKRIVDKVENIMDEFVGQISVWGSWVISNLLVINMILSIVIIFFQRRDPQTVWTWLLVLYFIPILGFFLYLLIGQDMHKSKMFKVKEISDEINSEIKKQEETIIQNPFDLNKPEEREFSDLILYNLESSGSVFTNDNAVTVYTDGNEKFDQLIEEMKRAKHYIHIQYYIIRKDELFEKIAKVLCKKAEEGVEIRILYDSMGCRGLKYKDWKKLENHGIQTAEFFPAVLKKLHLRINYRNHRKIVVIDGTCAFVGGFNVGREYLGLDKKFGYWRDTHLRLTGSAVWGLQIRFMLDWNFAKGDNLFRRNQYFTVQEELNTEPGTTGIQIISSGPDSKHQNIRNNYLKLINKAKHHIYIQTPYFIPDDAVLDSIRIASLSGVDVRVMIPCKPDHPFVYWATYSYIGDLLETGAKCYTYNNGFLHAKGMCVDGEVCCYGTANFDIRSFKLNFEVNAVIYDAAVTRELEESFLKDLEVCTRVTPLIYEKRTLLIRIKEQFSRLLSPLL